MECHERAILTWDELGEVAKSLFDVWQGQPELRWAKEAWTHLTSRGLASYSNDLEKCRTKIRLIALAAFYCDFCYLAWDEAAYPTYDLWAELLEISEVRVGQLIGSDSELSTEEEEERLFQEVLRKLVRSARQEVFGALVDAYGNTSALLVALWNSNKDHEPKECDFGVEGCNDCEQSADEILNYDIEEKGPAFTWLEQGADEVLVDG